MLNLTLDIGNTYAKAGYFDHERLLEVRHHLPLHALTALLTDPAVQAVIVSTVKPLPPTLTEQLHTLPRHVFLKGDTPLPFKNLYATPHTLGTDRMAAVAGALQLYPDMPALCVDAGTCITYDLLDAQCRYHGGAIAPGLQMRLKAMHTFTARLPLIETQEVSLQDVPLTGKNTYECMLSGAVHGTAAEITEMIRMYTDKFANLRVIICGGDASCLTALIKQKHLLVPELTLIGLNRILLHNVL